MENKELILLESNRVKVGTVLRVENVNGKTNKKGIYQNKAYTIISITPFEIFGFAGVHVTAEDEKRKPFLFSFYGDDDCKAIESICIKKPDVARFNWADKFTIENNDK